MYKVKNGKCVKIAEKAMVLKYKYSFLDSANEIKRKRKNRIEVNSLNLH